MFCPLIKEDCKEIDCEWFNVKRGPKINKDTQKVEIVDQSSCVIFCIVEAIKNVELYCDNE